MLLNKKPLIKSVFFLTIIFTLSSCASTYYIHKEKPMTAKKPGQYKSFYISWLDLRPQDYKKYGYESQASWTNVIKEQNINGLRPYMREMFPNKTLYFGNPMEYNFPTKGDLYIKLDVIRIDKNWNAFSGGFDDLYVNVSFYDVKTRKELYSGSINTTSMGMGPQGWSFEGRLGFAVYNLCSFVYDKLYQ